MAVASEAQWQRLFAARTRADVGEGIAAILALLGVPDLISFAGGFPDPLTFPRERAAALLAEFAAAGEASRVPVRADARARRPARRARGQARGAPGPAAGRRRAADHERRDRGARARRQVVPRPRRPRRRRGADLPRRDHGVPRLRGRGRRRADRRARARGRRARAAARRRPAPEAALHDPRSPEPGRRQPLRRAARARSSSSRGATASSSSRTSPTASSRFDGEAAPSLWSLAPDVVVQTGTTSKTFFPGVRLGWAVGPAEVSAQLVSAKQNTDQCAGALGQRLFEEYVRRGWIDEQLAASRVLYRRKCERMLAALERFMPAERALDAAGGRLLLVADAARRRRRDAARAARRRAGRRHRPRRRRSSRTAAAATTCACRSASSTRRRSTTASSGSRRS